MKLAPWHAMLIDLLTTQMGGWKYVEKYRHFERRNGGVKWFMHLAFINHDADFDAVVDVAVEFLRGKSRACIIGASLGNIEGIGQVRFHVAGPGDIVQAAKGVIEQFERVGIPFLERFSQPEEVLAVLKRGGSEARLISPLEDRHAEQMRNLSELANAI